MRNTLTPLFPGTVVLIVSFGALNGVHAQEKQASSPDLPVRNEIHRQYRLVQADQGLLYRVLGMEFAFVNFLEDKSAQSARCLTRRPGLGVGRRLFPLDLVGLGRITCYILVVR